MAAGRDSVWIQIDGLKGVVNDDVIQQTFASFRILEVSHFYPYQPNIGVLLAFVRLSTENPTVVRAFVEQVNRTRLNGVDLRGRTAHPMVIDPNDPSAADMGQS